MTAQLSQAEGARLLKLATNASVTVAVILIAAKAESIAAVIYILWSARTIMRDAFNELLDREQPEEHRQQILHIAGSHLELRGVHDLRTRSSGRVEFIELHLQLEGGMSLFRSHAISGEVEAPIMTAMPAADVVIHQNPAWRL